MAGPRTGEHPVHPPGVIGAGDHDDAAKSLAIAPVGEYPTLVLGAGDRTRDAFGLRDSERAQLLGRDRGGIEVGYAAAQELLVHGIGWIRKERHACRDALMDEVGRLEYAGAVGIRGDHDDVGGCIRVGADEEAAGGVQQPSAERRQREHRKGDEQGREDEEGSDPGAAVHCGRSYQNYLRAVREALDSILSAFGVAHVADPHARCRVPRQWHRILSNCAMASIQRGERMKIFVTGVNGYIGAVLAPYLMERGLQVVGLDTGYYRDGWLYSDNRSLACSPLTLNKDLRDVTAADLGDCEAVVHLAELSNDPLGQNNPAVTHQINHRGSVTLAGIARDLGIRRFVYASSCSVYGAGTGEFLDETSPTNPQTAYAECKVLVEGDIGRMAGDGFCPVFLRNATAYGPSPRMRFDIVLNDLSALAWTTQKIAMISDGSPWRPVVHIQDICEAVYRSLLAPEAAVRGRIFNVGQNSDNYRVRELAAIVAAEFPGCEVTVGPSGGDNRSYRVNFDRIHRELPGFRCAYTPQDGARQLRALFERIQLSTDLHRFRGFTRLKQLLHLKATGQINQDFYWV